MAVGQTECVSHGWSDVLAVLLGAGPLSPFVCVYNNFDPERQKNPENIFSDLHTCTHLHLLSHTHIVYTHSNTHTHQEMSGLHTSVTVSANCSPFAPSVGSVCQLLCLCCPFTPLHTSTYTHRCTRHHLHHHLPTNIYHCRLSQQSWYHSGLIMPCIAILCCITYRKTHIFTSACILYIHNCWIYEAGMVSNYETEDRYSMLRKDSNHTYASPGHILPY